VCRARPACSRLKQEIVAIRPSVRVVEKFRSAAAQTVGVFRPSVVTELRHDSTSVDLSSDLGSLRLPTQPQSRVKLFLCVFFISRCHRLQIYSIPDRGAEYYIGRVCLFVCLSTSDSPESPVRSSQNFLFPLSMSVARSFSGGVAICYVLPILWMTSCLHIMVRNRRHNSDSIGSSMDLTLRRILKLTRSTGGEV